MKLRPMPLLSLSMLVCACGGGVAPDHDAPNAIASASAPLAVTTLTTCTAADQQNDPAISGTRVAYSRALAQPTSNTNWEVVVLDVATSATLFTTSTPDAQEFLQKIDGDNVAYTRTGAGAPGDIQVTNLATQTTVTAAASTENVYFQQPAIAGKSVVFLRVGTDVDVYLYDLDQGPIGAVQLNDGAVQAHPATDGTWIVYEDWATGASVVTAVAIPPFGQPFGTPFAIGSGVVPDIDGGVVVFTEADASGVDQIFLYDLSARTSTQLTTSTSHKIQARISGGRVVWSDDRAGDLDVYGFDVATRTEVALATGAGNQFLASIHGDRVVYTNDETGCEQLSMVAFPPITPPPSVAGTTSDVRGFFASGDIKNQGIENALLSKLAAAQAAREAGDCAGAAAILQAFINSVNAQTGKGISAAAATQLVADARSLVDHCA